MFLATKFLNSMKFCVKVPVLSENTYSTWPNSSIRLDDCTVGVIPLDDSNSGSRVRKPDWKSLTTSSVTIKEIGTKLLIIVFGQCK